MFRKKLLLVMVLLSLCVTAITFSDLEEVLAFARGKHSLKGVTRVFIMVNDLSQDLEDDGLKTDQIRVDAELKLRLAGINVLTKKEYFDFTKHIDCEILSITVNDLKNNNNVYAIHTGIYIIQTVSLNRNPRIKLAVRTWISEKLFNIGSVNVRQIRDDIKDDLDVLINDYLSVNPKKEKK